MLADIRIQGSGAQNTIICYGRKGSLLAIEMSAAGGYI
jgi:hypothetical protein